MLCAACATTEGTTPRRCPEPNAAEFADYARIVQAAPDRPAVRWVARVVAWCWPEEAEGVRQ